MIAAIRILSWLRDRRVRRSSSSNMAFPPGACSFLSRWTRSSAAPAPDRRMKATPTIAAPARLPQGEMLARRSNGVVLRQRNVADSAALLFANSDDNVKQVVSDEMARL